MSRQRRAVMIALGIGGGHALGVAALVRWLGYPIDALANAPGGTAGGLLGLTLLLGVPAFLAVSHRLATPLAAAVLGSAWAVGLEFATARPEFSELGGYTVVIGPRYVDGYVDAWYAWLLAYLLLGAAEVVLRMELDRLPALRDAAAFDRLRRRDRGTAIRVGAAFGVAHAAVFLLLAADWGYFEPGNFLPAPWYVGLGVFGWTVLGLVAIGAVVGVALARLRLIAPTVALAWLVRRTAWNQQLPLPDDPLPVYFLGWFVFAGGLVAVGGVEWLLRAAWARFKAGPERA